MLPGPQVPPTGAVFLDARGDERALRLSWHEDAGVVVLSLWRSNVCAGSFRLPVDEVPDLIATLAAGLSLTLEGVDGGRGLSAGA